jgi:hypothetical protein
LIGGVSKDAPFAAFLKAERDVGLRMLTGARTDIAIADFDPAPGPLVARFDLRDQITFLQPRREQPVPPGAVAKKPAQREENDRELRFREHLALPQP